MTQVYELETATLALTTDNQRLAEALTGPEDPPLPHQGYLWRPRKELRLLLGDIERPFFPSNRVTTELCQRFFPGGAHLGSLAVIPLWVRDEMLGALNLGSAQPKRFEPGLAAHFLKRLRVKTARALDATCFCAKASSTNAGKRPWIWLERPVTSFLSRSPPSSPCPATGPAAARRERRQPPRAILLWGSWPTPSAWASW